MWDLLYRIGLNSNAIWDFTKEEGELHFELTKAIDNHRPFNTPILGIGENQTWIKDL